MSLSQASLLALAGAAGRGDLRSLERLLIALIDNDAGSGAVKPIAANLTINKQNARSYNGKTLVFSTAATLTIGVGLPDDFGISVVPPAAGNASIASDGTTTLNGATATLTRAASNTVFAVIKSGVNAYAVSGS